MKKLLIVEDDKFLQGVYKVKMPKEGFDVKIVSNGKEALEAIIEWKPNLVLLDLVMPEVDGFTVLDEVRKKDTMKNIPIVVASNLGQQEDIAKAMSMGANDYIVKSDTSINDIVKKIQALLS